VKLLVIVLCLLSERYLIHVLSFGRFQWFNTYCNAIAKRLSGVFLLSYSWVLLALMVLPLLIIIELPLCFFGHFLYGTIGFLLNLVIFYYCIGPVNPFYPVRVTADVAVNEEEVGEYLVQVNGQLFAVIFWYVALGPLGALLYRLVSLAQNQETTNRPARVLTDIYDWLPVRITSILYMLVGNFQAGLVHYSKLFFSMPKKNKELLSRCGLAALGCGKESATLLPDAEYLVEHAVILLLVLFALFTMVAWI